MKEEPCKQQNSGWDKGDPTDEVKAHNNLEYKMHASASGQNGGTQLGEEQAKCSLGKRTM